MLFRSIGIPAPQHPLSLKSSGVAALVSPRTERGEGEKMRGASMRASRAPPMSPHGRHPLGAPSRQLHVHDSRRLPTSPEVRQGVSSCGQDDVRCNSGSPRGCGVGFVDVTCGDFLLLLAFSRILALSGDETVLRGWGSHYPRARRTEVQERV